VQYYEPMLVPLALGNGLALPWVYRFCADSSRRPRLAVFVGAVVAACWLGPAVNIFTSLANGGREYALERYPQFVAAVQTAQYLKEHTEPNERILIVGSEPEIFFYADRRSCTRMIITYPLTGPYPYSQRLQQEYMDDLEQCRPRYIVYCLDPSSVSEHTRPLERFLNRIRPILDRSYAAEVKVSPELGAVPMDQQMDREDFLMVILRRK
jgi:hypothetical protein